MSRVKYNNELLDHKLACKSCNVLVSLEDVKTSHRINKKDRFIHMCEHCKKSSEVKISVKGFYSLYTYNKDRYIRKRV